jgi:hypothetical protein
MLKLIDNLAADEATTTLRMLPMDREHHARCRNCPTRLALKASGRVCTFAPMHDYCEGDPRPHGHDWEAAPMATPLLDSVRGWLEALR